MKDLDFDELDRAVNSLITSTPAEPKAVDAEKTVTITPTLGVNDQPTSGALEAAAAQVVDNQAVTAPPAVATPAAPVSTPQPLAARRSSGRFMDVVHPSSNMRTTTPAVAPISRQGMTLTPPAAPTEVPAPSPVVDTVPTATPTPTTSGATDWPDPLDFHGFAAPESTPQPTESTTPVDTSAPGEDDDDINQIAQDIDNSLGQTEETPQTSPFLSDAKVDKRPLGAFSTEPAAASAPEPPAEPAVAEPPQTDTPAVDDAQALPDKAPLPEELQSNLLSIESDSDHAAEPPVDEAPAQEATEPVGPTSITQQYKEQPSTGDQQTGNIYDTSSYHKALAHPAKKKSGWMWVVWTAILLVVGAGAGAAVYFYVLPILK